MSADDQLIRDAKAGDPAAWAELYRAHAGRLLVWLGTRPSGDAAVGSQDVAAEAWLVAAEKISGFTGTAEEFGGWLFGIARKLAANTRRRSLRRGTHPAAEPPGPGGAAGPEPELVARDWVAHVLRALPPRERDVVACLDVVGLDVAGTARALGISTVAVRVAHHRGLRRLRGRQDPPAVVGDVPGQPSTEPSRSR